MYQGIFSSNTKALRDYVHILPWQIKRIFLLRSPVDFLAIQYSKNLPPRREGISRRILRRKPPRRAAYQVYDISGSLLSLRCEKGAQLFTVFRRRAAAPPDFPLLEKQEEIAAGGNELRVVRDEKDRFFKRT